MYNGKWYYLNNGYPYVWKKYDFYTTAYSMDYLEELGLLKMDFLALRNLTIIANVLELIKENTGKVLDLNLISLNDSEIFKKHIPKLK